MTAVPEKVDVLVVGGGPGGLSCATQLARQGVRVALAERKTRIGPKVCAGGITWHGLIRHVPQSLIERAFPEQHILTPWQRVVVAEPDPIVATVSRERLGRWMAEAAEAAGVRLLTGTRVASLEAGRAELERLDGRRTGLAFGHLVGADGSNSLVRRWLGLPATMGVGLQAMVAGDYPRMEWHLDCRRFGSGYAWIFPRLGHCSIGSYSDAAMLPARVLKARLLAWAAAQNWPLDEKRIQAGLVNFDYRGVRFGRAWLVGDAAGLASALTGEGIYPALISGTAVARLIVDPTDPAEELQRLARKHHLHRRALWLAGSNWRLCTLLLETLVLLLRLKILAFRTLEMAD